MSLLEDASEVSEASAEDTPSTERPSPVKRVRLTRPALVRTVGVLLALFLIWLVCADPIAHVWYQSRQRGLASQAAGALTHLGSQTPKTGDAVAVLQDPTIGMNLVIAQGDSPAILRGGPGHRPGTPMPGARGNSVVVGHAKDWGAPFKALAKLSVGSTLYVQAHPGVYHLPETGDFVYTVRSVSTVPASDTQFLRGSTDYRITLITDVGQVTGNRVLVVTLVSGALGKVRGTSVFPSLQPSKGSILNSTTLGLLLGMAVIVVAYRFLVQRHRALVVVSVLLPVFAFSAVALFLDFDTLTFRALA